MNEEERKSKDAKSEDQSNHGFHQDDNEDRPIIIPQYYSRFLSILTFLLKLP